MEKEVQQWKASTQLAWIHVRDVILHYEETRSNEYVAPQLEGTVTVEMDPPAAAQYWIGT